MIRPYDFDIGFDTEPTGTVVRVTHIRTGKQRIKLSRHAEKVGRVLDALIAELRGKLFAPNDIRVDVGRSTSGDFIRVIHIPSGIQRIAMRQERSETDLLDEVLDELYADPAKLRMIRETMDETEDDGNN